MNRRRGRTSGRALQQHLRVVGAERLRLEPRRPAKSRVSLAAFAEHAVGDLLSLDDEPHIEVQLRPTHQTAEADGRLVVRARGPETLELRQPEAPEPDAKLRLRVPDARARHGARAE